MATSCPYATLEVSCDASNAAITKAFRTAAIKWHPDKCSSDEAKEEAKEQMQKVNFAYGILKQKEYRSIYDNEKKRNSTEAALEFVMDKMDADMRLRLCQDEAAERETARKAGKSADLAGSHAERKAQEAHWEAQKKWQEEQEEFAKLFDFMQKLKQQKAAEAARREAAESAEKKAREAQWEAEKKERRDKAAQEKAAFQEESTKRKKAKADKKKHREVTQELENAKEKARKQVASRLQRAEVQSVASQKECAALESRKVQMDIEVNKRIPGKIRENEAKKNRKGPDFSKVENLKTELKKKEDELKDLKNILQGSAELNAASKLQAFFMLRFWRKSLRVQFAPQV